MSIEPEWGSTLVFPNSPSSPAPFLSQSPVQSSSLRLDTGETSETREESTIPLEDSSSEDSERGRSRSDSGARSAQIAGLAIASAFRMHTHAHPGVASTPPPTPLARVPLDAESPLRDDFTSDLSDMTSPKTHPISSPAPTPPTTPQNRVGTGGSIDYGHRPTFYKAVTLEPKRGPSPMHKKGSSSFKTQSTAHSVGIPPTPPVTPASSQLRASAIAAAHSGTGPTPPPTPTVVIETHHDDPKSPGSFVGECHVTECHGRGFLRGYCTKHWRLARRNTEDEEGLVDLEQDEDISGDSKIASVRSPTKQGIAMPWLVYSEEGESHWKEWKDPLQNGEKDSSTLMSQSLASKSVVFEKYTNPKTQFELSPSAQIICVLTGVLGIQASTGPMKTFAPGECVLLEDVKGKGHRIVLIGGGSHTVLRTLLTRETTSSPLPFLPIVSEEETDAPPVDEYEGIEIDTTSSLDTTAVHR